MGGITRARGRGYVGVVNAKARFGKGVILMLVSDENGVASSIQAPEFPRTGLLILFEAGTPPELAGMSAPHEPESPRGEPPEPGDVLALGDKKFRTTAVGDRAWKNVGEAGLPGGVHAEETDGLDEPVRPGTRLATKEASS